MILVNKNACGESSNKIKVIPFKSEIYLKLEKLNSNLSKLLMLKMHRLKKNKLNKINNTVMMRRYL